MQSMSSFQAVIMVLEDISLQTKVKFISKDNDLHKSYPS